MFIMLSVLLEHLSMLIFVIETEYSSVQTGLTVLEVFGPKSKAWTQADVDLKVVWCYVKSEEEIKVIILHAKEDMNTCVTLYSYLSVCAVTMSIAYISCNVSIAKNEFI